MRLILHCVWCLSAQCPTFSFLLEGRREQQALFTWTRWVRGSGGETFSQPEFHPILLIPSFTPTLIGNWYRQSLCLSGIYDTNHFAVQLLLPASSGFGLLGLSVDTSSSVFQLEKSCCYYTLYSFGPYKFMLFYSCVITSVRMEVSTCVQSAMIN